MSSSLNQIMSQPLVSNIPPPSTQSTTQGCRKLANYSPSVWGDYFLTYESNINEEIDIGEEQYYNELKETVKNMLISTKDNLTQKLELIDAVQRLSVSYHFTKEIHDALERIYRDINNDTNNMDLYVVALRFRLLRQHGYHVSCDIFNDLQDESGKFKESIFSDVRGMLSLYEAAHCRVRGEQILDDALSLTTSYLESSLDQQVISSLKWPIRKRIPRIDARNFLSSYEEEDSRNDTLIKFARLDFNKLQALHRKELGKISLWWKDLDFANKLSYARNRLVECYFWIMGVYYEPHYHIARIFLTKVIALTSIIDDTYDAYGIFEELKLYTEAIERWDKSAMDLLPEYMKLSYKALLDVYDEIEEETTKQGRPYCAHYGKEAMKRLVKAYFAEARWWHEGYVPTMEEYMEIALVTGAYSMLAVTSLVGMKDFGTKEAFDWVSKDPKIVRASSVICRLMDDIVSHKFEKERGIVASAVECYMREHGVSEQQVRELFLKEVENAWKDINGECLSPTAVPMPLLERVLNLARIIDFIYKEEDGYTNVSQHLRDSITELLIDPIDF